MTKMRKLFLHRQIAIPVDQTSQQSLHDRLVDSNVNVFSSKLFQRQPVYATTSTYSKPLASGYGSRVRHIKEANELRESGEYDDFKQDLVYILSSLQSSDASMKVKCLR